MENQNNQNDKPADGYSQAPQQEEKSVLAELAEFVSRKKEAAVQSVKSAPVQETIQEAGAAVEKMQPENQEQNATGASDAAVAGAPEEAGAEKTERPARNNRSRGPRRPRSAAKAPKKEEGAEVSEEGKQQEERKPRTQKAVRNTAARGEKTARGERTARTEKADKAAGAEKQVRAEKPARAERPARSEKPVKAPKAKNVLADTASKPKVRIIPLGGLEQIGMNITAFEYEDTIVVVDCGLAFPTDDMLGIDLVIPDITYLVENKDKVKAIFLTHGHEDHIGALPYVMKQIGAPVYGTALTLGILQGRLKENGVSSEACKIIKPGDKIYAGNFKVEFIRVNHSIPDAVALAIHTPIGIIIHTGDFKFDQTPVDGQVTEFNKFAEFGDQGVLALMADSTNAERPGYTQSEKIVGQTFDDEFRYAKNRIIVATFSSNVHRIQQVVDSAVRYKRKVAVIGRSMVNVVNISMELGYLKIPEGVLIDIDESNNYTPDKIVIITTGSQGEPMSALTRMAMSDHKKVDIVPGDTVIISATPIPGNEKLVSRTIDHLYKLGADVIYEKSNGVHVSGHASQEEIKMMHNLVRPKFFIPVHGEYRHLIKHAQLAGSLGMPRENIVVGENGSIIELTRNSIGINGRVPSGKVLVDGLGVGDVGNIVLRDRRQLSQDGIMIVVVTIDKDTCTVVSGPDIVSRGFVYVREAEGLMETAKEKVQQALDKCEQSNVSEWSVIKSAVRDSLGRFLYEKTRRRPMILPIIMEI